MISQIKIDIICGVTAMLESVTMCNGKAKQIVTDPQNDTEKYIRKSFMVYDPYLVEEQQYYWSAEKFEHKINKMSLKKILKVLNYFDSYEDTSFLELTSNWEIPHDLMNKGIFGFWILMVDEEISSWNEFINFL